MATHAGSRCRMTITPPETKAPHTGHGDSQPADLIHNRILAVLPAEQLAALRPHFSRIALPTYAILRVENTHMENLYFPTAAIDSNVVAMANGRAVEGVV